MSSVTKFLKGGLLLSVASIVMRLSGVLVLVPIARLLGPKHLGIYSLVFSLVQSGNILGRLGIDAAMHRNGAHLYSTDPVATGRLLGVGSTLIGLSFAALTAAVWIGREPLATYWLRNPEAAAWFSYAAVNLFIEGISCVAMTGLLSLHNFKAHSLATSTGGLGRLLLSPLLAWCYGLSGAFLGLIVASLLQAGVAFIYFRRSSHQHHIVLRLEGFWQESYQIMRFGIPFYAGNALIGLVFLPMMGEVGRVAGLETLGQIRIGQSLSQIVGFLPGAIAPVAISILSEAHSSEVEDFQRLRSIHLRSNWILALSLVTFLSVTSSSVVNLLFGSAYQAALPLVVGLSWWAALTVVVESFNLYSLSAGYTKAIAVGALLQKIVFISLTFWFLPQWEGMAFIFGLLLGSILQLIVMLTTLWSQLEALLKQQIGILFLWSLASIGLVYGGEQLNLPMLTNWLVALLLSLTIAGLGTWSIFSSNEKKQMWGRLCK